MKADKKSDLRKLRRVDLLELLVEMGKENDHLKEELQRVREELESRELKIECAGSMAEAALALNGVFEAADAAYEQYVSEARLKAELVVAQAQEEARAVVSQAKEEADEVLSKAREEARGIIDSAQKNAECILDEAEAILDEARNK